MSQKKGEGHHGGAWKVAYADFVTAMMALFMVLWIIGQNQEKLEAIADYFKDPIAYEHDVLMGQKNLSGEGSLGQDGTGLSKMMQEKMKALASSIYKSLNLNENAKDNPADVFITPDGIRILIYNLPNHRFFEDDCQLTRFGELVTRSLAWILDPYEGTLDVSIYDVLLKDETQLKTLQQLLRTQNPSVDPKKNLLTQTQTKLTHTYESLVYHGFRLSRVGNLSITNQIPEGARHDCLMVDLSLHVNTVTIMKK